MYVCLYVDLLVCVASVYVASGFVLVYMHLVHPPLPLSLLSQPLLQQVQSRSHSASFLCEKVKVNDNEEDYKSKKVKVQVQSRSHSASLLWENQNDDLDPSICHKILVEECVKGLPPLGESELSLESKCRKILEGI